MHQRVHETLLDRGPLLFVSNDEQQVRWMKEESPWIYPGECQFDCIARLAFCIVLDILNRCKLANYTVKSWNLGEVDTVGVL
jgi:hypothetical protein